MKQLSAFFVFVVLFQTIASGQGVFPSHENLQAYFDSNFDFIKLSARKDGVGCSYLPTSYVDSKAVENFIQFTYEKEFVKYSCQIYQVDNDFVLRIDQKSISFPPTESKTKQFVNEGLQLQFLDGFHLNIQFPSKTHFGHNSFNVAKRLLYLNSEGNYTIRGTSATQLAHFTEQIPHSTIINSTLIGDGIYVHVFYHTELPMGAWAKPVPYRDVMFHEKVQITGDETSIKTFLGLPVNSSWGTIRCAVVGDHTVVELTIGNEKIDYLLDTGASFLTIDDELANSLMASKMAFNLYEDMELEIANGEKITARTILIKKIKVGDVLLENVIAASTPNNPKLLGMSVLKKFKSWKVSEDGRWLRYKK